jgi:hypothetical protein
MFQEFTGHERRLPGAWVPDVLMPGPQALPGESSNISGDFWPEPQSEDMANRGYSQGMP